MKKLTISFLLFASFACANDLYFDAYRFDSQNYTGMMGAAIGDYNVEYSFSDGSAAIGGRKYMAFTNIEIGIQGMVSNSVAPGSKNHRVVDIEGGWHATMNPYFKAGSDLFVTVKLDESNKAVIQVGFKLY